MFRNNSDIHRNKYRTTHLGGGRDDGQDEDDDDDEQDDDHDGDENIDHNLQGVHPSQASSGGRQRVGLRPTDRQESYKRSAMRNSRRSRAERTSYLVATGHLNLEETEQLNQRPSMEAADFIGLPKEYLDNPSSTPLPPPPALGPQITSNLSHNTSSTDPEYRAPKNANATGIVDEQSLLEDYHNLGLSSRPQKQQQRQQLSFQQQQQQQKNPFGPSRQSSIKKYRVQLRGGDLDSKVNDKSPNNDRRKFKQTYSEVTVPMKTSPTFEYILKANRRRNKRCCLWLLYASLVTICLTIIVFCCFNLLMRHQNPR